MLARYFAPTSTEAFRTSRNWKIAVTSLGADLPPPGAPPQR